ncbi:MAG: preprotein translocase subunit SecG [Myxococcota bacterium]
MYPFFVALHVLLCLFLILIIMLQPGKGGDPGLAFGGGGGVSTIFGPRGPAGILQRATTVVAVLYMATTITLALYSNRGMLAGSNVDDELLRLQQLEKQQAAPPIDGAPIAPPGGDAPSTP